MTLAVPPAPPPFGDLALVLAAHGNRGEDRSNDLTRRHAEALAGEGRFRTVGPGYLKGEPPIEDAMRRAAGAGARQILVYPLFMADGYFTRTLLPQRIDGAGVAVPWRLLPPLGFAAGLPALCEALARAAAAAAGHVPEASRLIVVGHGSTKSRASANATYAFANALRRETRFGLVDCGFIEEPPFVAEALALDPRPAIVAGYFAGDGLHGGEDVPAALAGYGGPAVYIGALGGLAEIPALILAETVRALAHD